MRKENLKLCETINRLKTDIMFFGFAKVDSSWRGTNIMPLFSRLYYVTEGTATLVLKNGKTINLSPQKWYLLPSDCSHDFFCEKQMSHIYFHLKICSFDGIDLLRACKEPIFIEDAQFDLSEFEKYFSRDDIFSCLILRHIVENKILQILDKNNVTLKENVVSPCVAQAIKFINDNVSMSLSLDDVLNNVFVAKSTLTKYFRKELGMSIHQYIFDKIMFEAEQLLLQNNMSIGQISDKLDFYDQFYFSKCFKNRYGVSPAEYRKMKKKLLNR